MVFAKTQNAAQQAVAGQEIPAKFFPLVWYIIKATGKVFKQQLPMMVFFGVFGWLLHTVLLVFVNQGFGKGTWVGDLLATQGNGVAGTIIWMIGSGLLFSWIGQKLFGPKGVKRPKQPSFKEMFREAGDLAIAAMVATAGISLVIGIFAVGWANTALALGIGGTMLTAGGSVVGLLVSSAWSSTYGLKQSGKARKFSATTGKVAMAGSIAAFLLCTLPFMILWVKLILGLACLGLAFYLTHRQGKSGAAAILSILSSLFFVGTIAYLLGHITPALADDGGWKEAGGSFSSWIQSEGAARAMISGLFPGIGAAIGPSVYQVLISMGYNLNLGGGLTGGTAGGDGGIPPTQPTPPVDLVDENGFPLTRWEPDKYGAGDDGNAGGPGQVWYNGRWVDAAQARADINKINPNVNLPPAPKVNMTDESGDAIINWEPGKYGPDTKGNEGKPGMVWHWGEWVTPEQAQREINEDLARQAQDRAEQERNLAEWRAANARQLDKEREEGARQIAEANARRQAEAQQAAYNKQLQEHILSQLQKDPGRSSEASELAADGNLEGLKDLYRDKLGQDMTQSQRDADHYNTMATIYGVGEVGAKVVVAGAKGALIAVGGPAGMAVTGGLVGVVSATQEGTQAYVNGDSVGQIVSKTAVGFVSGVKDGAVGVYTQLPGISTAARYLVPAGADAAQTFVQATINDPSNITGNIGQALGSGALSIGSTYIGGRIDNSGAGALVKEGANLATGAAGGAISSVIQGGDAGEGALEGLIGAAGGRIGGAAGTHVADTIRTNSETPVRTALGDAEAGRKVKIGLEGQADNVQELIKTKGQPENGKTYVDQRGTLDQLRDTQSSRTAKQAPNEVKQPIIDTRADKIYKPADDATIAKANQTLTKNGMLQPGDRLEMDTFSTPGKTGPSLGADRDARLVIVRQDPENPNQTVKIEVPREHWENDAYQDFYDHTTKIAGGPEAITPEKYPNYFKNVEEMTRNNPQGLSQEQIKARAWAEEHNQLFTDKNHMEASVDNSDQITKFIGGKEVQTQGRSNVEVVQEGGARMLDPEGYAKMWHEKSEVYSRMGNQPEAIAQSQKGIEAYMKIREGYDKQGLNLAPVDPQTAKAMEIITKSPVGVNATPQAMADVNKQLQSLGFHDTNDALGKIAMQNETVGFATTKGLSSANTTRIGISGIEPPEPPNDGVVY